MYDSKIELDKHKKCVVPGQPGRCVNVCGFGFPCLFCGFETFILLKSKMSEGHIYYMYS